MTAEQEARRIIYLAAGGSAALLLGAFIFEYLGYAPCKLCIWQRWPHGVAIAAGALVVFLGPLFLLTVVGTFGALISGGIGAYHSGVELGWWEGPSSCTGNANALSGLSGADLLSTNVPVDIVMCDEVAWAFAGLSMATWNAIFSLILAVIWFQASKVLAAKEV